MLTASFPPKILLQAQHKHEITGLLKIDLAWRNYVQIFDYKSQFIPSRVYYSPKLWHVFKEVLEGYGIPSSAKISISEAVGWRIS